MNRRYNGRTPKLTLCYKSNGRKNDQPIQKTALRDSRKGEDEHAFNAR